MGHAHHSLREHPIMFGFAETGSSPLYIKLIKKEKATLYGDFYFFGGDDRARTCDPLHVKQVL